MNPNIFPDGLDIAYQEVKRRQQRQQPQNNQQNNQTPQNNEEMINQKKAAGLPKSQGSNVMTNQEGEQSNQEIKDRLFKNKGGMFGRK